MKRQIKIICAWCEPKEIGENISHGVCKSCAAKMLAEMELLKTGRKKAASNRLTIQPFETTLPA